MSDPDITNPSTDDEIDLDRIAADFDRIETALRDPEVAPTPPGASGDT